MLTAAKTVRTTARTTALAALTALSVAAIPAAPARAWGEGEQNFVAGVVTAVVVGEMLKQGRKSRAAPPAPTYAPAPVYADPAPTYTTTSIYATPVARAFNTYSAAERKAIQRSLRQAGYYAGGIDGSFGPRTYNAVVSYARDAGAAGNLRTTGGAFAVYDGLIF
ncbi:peptidoglycan-binding protein [Rhodobacter sp. Har01]|uniref:peptidoglycan-binding domain-containing protein n=1 Tax=Rhodobacter sp. Har01 TaxID=2883999 RepID=UPI001D099D1A|nr:peptidoglycan-binding domain-containing protein [Rhodobacter sp. Har01]MCB6179143.1 peptidoglycan-binding protein [Rhodobacter sp. Har01]